MLKHINHKDSTEYIPQGYHEFYVDSMKCGHVEIKKFSETLRAELWSLEISDEFRGKGYSHILMQDIIENCRLEGIKIIWLGVVPENARAIHVYKKAGFVEVENHKGSWYSHMELVLGENNHDPEN